MTMNQKQKNLMFVTDLYIMDKLLNWSVFKQE